MYNFNPYMWLNGINPWNFVIFIREYQHGIKYVIANVQGE